MYSGRTRFRGSTFLRYFSLVSVVVSVFFFRAIYISEGWNILAIFLCVLSILSIAVVISAFASYLHLNQEDLEFRSFIRKVVIPKNSIESCKWEKGCPIVLMLANGDIIELPELAEKNISTSINAWLKN